MKRISYAVAVVLTYTVLYWVTITLWSLVGFARIGGIAEKVDFVLRIVAIPFLLGVFVASSFRRRLQMWALGIAPFVSSAALLYITGVDWDEIKNGVLGFWVVGIVAACATIAGSVAARRAQLAK